MESTTSKGGFLGALVFPCDRCRKPRAYPAWCPLAQHGSITTYMGGLSFTNQKRPRLLKDRPQLVWATLARAHGHIHETASDVPLKQPVCTPLTTHSLFHRSLGRRQQSGLGSEPSLQPQPCAFAHPALNLCRARGQNSQT